MSPRVVGQLLLVPENTKRVFTVANGEKTGVLGKLNNLPVTFDDFPAHLDFVVLDNLPFDIVIGRPTLKRLGGLLDFQKEEVILLYHELNANLPRMSQYKRPREVPGDTYKE